MRVAEDSNDKLKVFISYSRVDMASADALVAALEAEGFAVTIDRRDLPYGEKWQDVLYEYIRDCDTVVFLISARSIQSQWVRWELQQVTSLRKRLIPVMLEMCSPESLPPAIASVEVMPKQGAFALEPQLSELTQALNTNRGWVMEATKLQSRTLDWIAAGKTSGLLLRGAALEAAEGWRAAKPKAETIPGGVLDFLLSSRQQANRRQRYWVAGSLVVAAGASLLAATAYSKSREAVRQKIEAEHQRKVAVGQKVEADRQKQEADHQKNAAIAQSAALTSLSSDNDPSRGILLAREALLRSQGKPRVTTVTAHRTALLRFGPTPLLEAARRGLPTSDVSDAYAPFRDKVVTALEVSGNGRWLLVGTEEKGTRELWRFDLAARDPASTIRVVDSGLLDMIGSTSHTNLLHTIAVSNSGRLIATAPGLGTSSGSGVLLFELGEDGTYTSRVAKWSGSKPGYAALRFSQDERYLADGNHLWRLDSSGSEIEPILLAEDAGESDPYFSKDSKRIGLLTRSGPSIAVESRATSPAAERRRETFPSLAAARAAYPGLSLPPNGEKQQHLFVSQDGRWEISFNEVYVNEWTMSQPVVRHYDKAGRLQAETRLPVGKQAKEQAAEGAADGVVRQAAFSSDGHWLATIGSTLRLWDLTRDHPFSKPYLDFATPGTHVAIDPTGRWLASFGQRLQIWDLTLEAPAAFPVEPKSILNSLGGLGRELNEDDVKMHFYADGAWLLVDTTLGASKVAELWDLRFDDVQRDAGLARRNLTAEEWRSFFGDESYRKTFADQPVDARPLLEADDLARAGKVAEAVRAYQRVSAAEPVLKLDPQRRAARLAAQLYWERGEQAALEGDYASATRFLTRAKAMNPAIPWRAEARAGQLWARNWSAIVDRLGGRSNSWTESRDLETKVDVEAQLAELRGVMRRYPGLRLEDGRGDFAADPGDFLYQSGLQELGERLKATIGSGDLAESSRLRAILAREKWREVPGEAGLREQIAQALKLQFKSRLESYDLAGAEKIIELVAEVDTALAARMRSALELVASFDQIEQADRAGDVTLAGAKAQRFGSLMKQRQSLGDAGPGFDLIGASQLNSMCWKGTTRHGLALTVLPICDAAVALTRDGDNLRWLAAQCHDSRGVAYAALGRLDKAVADFEAYIAFGLGDTKSRREWVEALKACKADPARCQNPLADPAYLRSIH
ncbi:MAG TPA: TIR domain-containing protein [Thermoanaerobaculia bacterium]